MVLTLVAQIDECRHPNNVKPLALGVSFLKTSLQLINLKNEILISATVLFPTFCL
jgi:hypothetical protein